MGRRGEDERQRVDSEEKEREQSLCRLDTWSYLPLLFHSRIIMELI